MRVASHSAANTAGTPITTESEIARPLVSKALAVATLASAFDHITSRATAASWPTNIAPNANRPHRLVPMNFQIRGGFSGADTAAGAASASISGTLIQQPSSAARLVPTSGQRPLEQ